MTPEVWNQRRDIDQVYSIQDPQRPHYQWETVTTSASTGAAHHHSVPTTTVYPAAPTEEGTMDYKLTRTVSEDKPGYGQPLTKDGWYPWIDRPEAGWTTLLSVTFQTRTETMDRLVLELCEHPESPPLIVLCEENDNQYDPLALEVLWIKLLAPLTGDLPSYIHERAQVGDLAAGEGSTLTMSAIRLGYIPSTAGGHLNKVIREQCKDQPPTYLTNTIVEVHGSIPAPGGKSTCHNLTLRISYTPQERTSLRRMGIANLLRL